MSACSNTQGDKLHVRTSKHAVMQVLYHVCQQVVASKPTTLVEDVASVQQAQVLQVQDQHHILALQFRIGKKELLQLLSLAIYAGGCIGNTTPSSCNTQGPLELHTEAVTFPLSRQAAYSRGWHC